MSETDFSRWNQETGQVRRDPAIALFKVIPTHMPFLSEQAGRPVYEDREFVDILIPGDRRTMVSEPVNEDHKKRWPREYAAFKEGREAPLDGTPLANWPNSRMTRSKVEELVYFHIRTVEQLAEVDDAKLVNLGMGARELREAAKTFLEVSRKGTAPLERLLAENQRLTDENQRLTRDLAEANARANAREQANART